ncbi:MAG: hypothetical protein JST01_08830 [Cyanobacteria bacterium SZAS TMP-1]|nr:hypothetical protein [Cyanobacteria bacterium SZAS TMP-1]
MKSTKIFLSRQTVAALMVLLTIASPFETCLAESSPEHQIALNSWMQEMGNHNPEHRISANEQQSIERWLAEFPKLAANQQSAIAPRALYCALVLRKKKQRRLIPRRCSFGYVPEDPSLVEADEAKSLDISTQIIATVLDAALTGDWVPTDQFTANLRRILLDNTIDEAQRAKARKLLTKAPPADWKQFKQALTSAQVQVKAALAHARKKETAIPDPLPPPSWQAKFMKSITEPDGRLKEHVAQAGTPTQIMHTFPLAEASRLTVCLAHLGELYQQLKPVRQEIFAADLIHLASDLQLSNVGIAAEKLLWRVFDTIDVKWPEHNAVESELQSYPFGYRVSTAQKKIKLYRKVLELEDYYNGNQPTNSNLRWVVGDLYDQTGKYKESKEQYDMARAIDRRCTSKGNSQYVPFADRDYAIRMGTYVSPYTADHPLK